MPHLALLSTTSSPPKGHLGFRVRIFQGNAAMVAKADRGIHRDGQRPLADASAMATKNGLPAFRPTIHYLLCCYEQPLQGLLAEGFIHEGVEFGVFAYHRLHDFAVGTHENLRWEALYGIELGSLHGTALRLIYVQPGQFILLHAGLPLIFALVAVDAQNLELALILLVILLHLGYTTHTPDAPGAPEVEQHILPLQRREA